MYNFAIVLAGIFTNYNPSLKSEWDKIQMDKMADEKKGEKSTENNNIQKINKTIQKKKKHSWKHSSI